MAAGPATWNTAYIRNGTVDGLTGRAANAGSYMRIGGGYSIIFYTGAPPASPDTAATGTQLASGSTTTITYPLASNGVSAFRAYAGTPTNSVSGTIGYARVYCYGGVSAIDLPATLSGGGGAGIMNTLTWVASTPLTVDMSVRIPQNVGTFSLSMQACNRLVDNINYTVTATPSILTSGVLTVYSGTAPSDADMPLNGDSEVLATTTLGTTSPWGTAVNGSSALSANIALTAGSGLVGTKTATFIRVVKGSFVLQGSCSSAGTPDFMLSTDQITASLGFNITSATLTFV